jgi:predicted metal-dependent HD superfamily phosphohydrolase
MAACTAPGRHDHDLTHIEDCLGALAGVDDLSAVERETLERAIWWHDVVYDRPGPDAGFAATYDRRARENLARELGSLRG